MDFLFFMILTRMQDNRIQDLLQDFLWSIFLGAGEQFEGTFSPIMPEGGICLKERGRMLSDS